MKKLCIVDNIGVVIYCNVAVSRRTGASFGRGKMSRKKISTTVYITADQLEKLKVLNEKTKVPVAEYIRQGIDLVLEKYKDKLPGQMELTQASPTSSKA
jgi:hypothetical protein